MKVLGVTVNLYECHYGCLTVKPNMHGLALLLSGSVGTLDCRHSMHAWLLVIEELGLASSSNSLSRLVLIDIH